MDGGDRSCRIERANGRYSRNPESVKKSVTPKARSGTKLANGPRSTGL
jgi:hypothetical protein